MQPRCLGKSDLKISPILMGTSQAGKDMWAGIDDDQTTGTHDRTQLAQIFVIYRRVEEFFWDTAAGWPTRLGRLERASARNAATDLINYFAQGNAHRYFYQARVA